MTFALIRFLIPACAAIAFALPLQSQDSEPENYHSHTVDFGVGNGSIQGQDRTNLHPWGSFALQAGTGFALTPPPEERYVSQQSIGRRRWDVFLTVDFFFEQATANINAVQQAVIANPQNTALLSATGGTAKFYSLALDPSLRIRIGSRWELYALGGFGWFRRSLNFAGPAIQGTLIQPTSPTSFAESGDSGGVDGGLGVNIRLRGRRESIFLSKGSIFLEGRFLHGLSINSGTWLVPLSTGWRW